MARRICIASAKGGVGKTTLALNLSVSMAKMGKSVLLVDLDPQGGINHLLKKKDTELPGLADVVAGAVPAESARLPTKIPGLHVLLRGRLDPVDTCAFEQALSRKELLHKVIERVQQDSDIVLMDTPSGVGGITQAALRVSHYVIIPVQVEDMAIRSLDLIFRVIQNIRKTDNPILQILTLVPTFIHKQDSLSVDNLRSVWAFRELVSDTFIPFHPKIREASRHGVPVSFFGEAARGVTLYFDVLASELFIKQSALEEKPHEPIESFF